MKRFIQILPVNPCPEFPKLRAWMRAVRIGKWCLGWAGDYRGITFLGAWRYGNNPYDFIT